MTSQTANGVGRRHAPARQATIAVVASMVALLLAATTSQARPAQQAPSCGWQGIGNASKAVYYPAVAMDTDNHQMYVYGGLDQALDTQNTVQKIDLSGTDIRPAPHGTVTGVASLKRFGAAGAYRSRGDDSAVYFVGGAGDVMTGQGTNDVQQFNVKTRQWSSLSAGGSLEDRLFPAAAYDPLHDVIWVTGGIKSCGISDATSGNCPARTFPTRYLAFDPTTGAAQWSQLGGTGPSQVYGHGMVFDPAGKRLLVVGGSRDGRVGTNDVWQLDLADADPANATWSTLSTAGVSLPRVALHGAALDTGRNWLVVYGGVTSNFNTPGENTPTTTYALDLGTTPPTWIDLGTGLQQRIGAGMAYSARHQGVVLAGGRRVSRAQPPQDVQRDSNILQCADQGTSLPPPETPVPTATRTAPPPTVLPPPVTATATQSAPPTQPATNAQVCAFIQRFNRVPPAAIADAMANPSRIGGWGKSCNPGVPDSGANPDRRYLSLLNINKPYHPLFNGLVFRCGCP